MAVAIPTEEKFRLPAAIARKYGLTTAAVHTAIRTGRLPARRVFGDTDYIYLVQPEDAERLWRGRLCKRSA